MEKPLKILVVEDDPIDQQAMLRLLRTAGFRADVDEAMDGKTGLAMIKEDRHDCVFLDFKLPDTDGLSILRAAREAGVEMPIVVMTGQGTETIAVDMMKAGATDYVPKSLMTADGLSSVLRNAFRVHRARQQIKEAQDEVKKTNHELQEFLDQASDLIQTISPDGKFLYVNEAWQEALGYTMDELENITILDILPQECQSRYFSASRAAMVKNPQPPLELVLLGKGGRRVLVEGGVNCRFVDDKAYSLRAIFHNVTARRELDGLRKELFGMVSHEVRQPLTAIRGALFLLEQSRESLSQEAGKTLDVAGRNSQNLMHLINDLLELERIEAPGFELDRSVVHCGPVLKEAVRIVTPYATTKNVTLELNETRASVFADGKKIGSVVERLLNFAVARSEEGGTVNLRTSHDDSGVTFQVTDNGAPLPEGAQSLLSALGRLNLGSEEKRHCSSLSLFICRLIVAAHNGKMTVDGDSDGARVVVVIPAQ